MSVKITDFVAEHHTDESGVPYIHATATVEGGAQITFTIHQSTCYRDTINVEVCGDFTDDPGLRINLNDRLIWDTTRNDPGITDAEDRPVDLDDEPGQVLLPELARKLKDREHPHDFGDYSDVQ